MKKLEVVLNYQNVTQRQEMSKCHWKNGAEGLSVTGLPQQNEGFLHKCYFVNTFFSLEIKAYLEDQYT